MIRTQSRGPGVASHSKERFFNVSLKLIPTGEMFTLKNIHNDMKISEMKSYAEFVTGIPTNIQRIRYLDEGDLLDSSTVRSNDIVGGAQLHMTVWSEWTKLVEAVSANDIDYVFKLGVTQQTEYRTPNLDYLLPSKRKQWLSNRAFVALYLAAHRGHQRLCERLIAQDADVNGCTQMGRTALHVASAMGHGSILDMLLEQGGDIDAEDNLGENALTIAGKFGHKACERHLFLFRWQERAKQIRTQVYVPMFAHQYFDSANPVWLKGNQAQVYYTQIMPPGEYEGSGLAAPKRPGWVAAGKEQLERLRSAESGDSDSDYDSDDERRSRLPRIGEKGQPLSAIREEKSYSRSSSATSTHAKSKTVSFSKSKKDKKQKNKSFDDWLAKKEAEDLVRLTAKRAELKKKREESDNKKKDEALKEAMKETSYEAWLAEQEAQNKKAKKDNKVQTATGGKTTKEVIRNLLARKQQEGGYHGLPTEIWMAERDPKLFNQIKVHGNLLLEHYN